MTIELTTEDMTEMLEQAAKYGTFLLKTKTTDGDDLLVAVQSPRAAVKRRAKPNSAEQQAAAPAPAAPVITQ